jgi:predicted glycoside hydrolase/deacetylase ChbG (UPF0249 family)
MEDVDAVEAEIRAQLDAFRDLVRADPTHLDSHQHVHEQEPAAGVMRRLADELAVPLRNVTRGIRYRGDFYGRTAAGSPLPDAITAERLIEIITALSPGVTELACHPGLEDVGDPAYGDERRRELEALCDPRVRDAISTGGIQLRSHAAS